MRMYEVLERTVDPRKGAAGDFVLVKEGFCWPALLFGPLWALYHRMWVVAAGLVSVGVIIALPPPDRSPGSMCRAPRRQRSLS